MPNPDRSELNSTPVVDPILKSAAQRVIDEKLSPTGISSEILDGVSTRVALFLQELKEKDPTLRKVGVISEGVTVDGAEVESFPQFKKDIMEELLNTRRLSPVRAALLLRSSLKDIIASSSRRSGKGRGYYKGEGRQFHSNSHPARY